MSNDSRGMKVDLHVHSDESDGDLSSSKLIQKAIKNKIKVISITDHNVCNSIYFKNKESRDIKIITGCEISTLYKGVGIEILGYGFSPEKLNKYLSKINKLKYREKRSKYLYTKYMNIIDENNIEFDKRKLNRKNAITPSFFKEMSLHEENKHLYIEFKNLDDFIRKGVYNPESIFYINLSKVDPSIKFVLRAIKKSGGKSFLAHVYKYNLNTEKELDNILLKKYGKYTFDGIEAFYTSFTEEQSNYLLDYAKNNDLIVSGGSDFHGSLKPDYKIGNQKIDICEQTDWINKYID